MAASSQDQPNGANGPQSATPASKPRSWLRLVIAIVAPILVIIIILVILTNLKVLPQNWFVPLLSTLGPIFGAIGAFINNTLLSNKDFQQSFRTWLGKRMLGETDEKKDNKDGKDAGTATQAAAQPITITINNTNAATPAGTPIATIPQSVPAASAPPSPASTNTTQSQPAPSVPQAQPATSPTAVPTLPASSDPVFFPGLELPDPKEFYGRMIEREQLLSRTRTKGCTSIVGPRRIGKT